MWNKVVSWLLSLYSLFYPGPGPCPSLQLMPANTLDQQQFLGKWYFRAAASRHQAHIAKFKPLDSLWFSMEKSGNDTLLLTGHMHMEGPPQEPAVERPVGQLPRVHHPTGGGARGGPEQTAAVRPPQGRGPRRGGRLSEERSLSQHVGQALHFLGKKNCAVEDQE
uniref:Apolipoprotein M n=1 Tax=Tetraodon nigroviridis TaxID=99883 RepID=H3C4P3_TETNG